MKQAELDKITADILALLKERGIVSVSKSGSTQAETGSVKGPAEAAVPRSPFKKDPMLVPVLITDRAAVLSNEDIRALFGSISLHKDESLSGGSRVVYQETVNVCGPDGEIGDVHVCAPEDNERQVELLSGDDLILGIKAPLRLSGDTESSPGLRIVSPSGASIELDEGAIIPMRKVTVDPARAKEMKLGKGQLVSAEVSGSRGGVLTNVAVIIREGADGFCHLDKNEAAAMCISAASMVKIRK
jgi:propanediol utilization protein